MQLGDDGKRNGCRPATANIDTRRAVNPACSPIRLTAQVLYQSLSPIDRPQKTDVGHVGPGKLCQVSPIADKVMTHTDRSIEQIEVDMLREFRRRVAGDPFRASKVAFLDIRRSMVLHRDPPAQLVRETNYGLGVQTATENQYAQGRPQYRGDNLDRIAVAVARVIG